MRSIPDAFLIHGTSGRARLKIPSKKGDKNYFAAVRDRLAKCSIVRKVEANSLTGSVLIMYVGDFKTVLDIAETNGIFKVKNFELNSAYLYQRVSSTFSGINNQVKITTGGLLDLGLIAFFSLIGASIYQISRGNFTAPAWYTALWYAMNIFLKGRNNVI